MKGIFSSPLYGLWDVNGQGWLLDSTGNLICSSDIRQIAANRVSRLASLRTRMQYDEEYRLEVKQIDFDGTPNEIEEPRAASLNIGGEPLGAY